MKALIKENDHNEIFKKIYGIDFDESIAEFLRYVTIEDKLRMSDCITTKYFRDRALSY
mgnify:CR=1 FL=1